MGNEIYRRNELVDRFSLFEGKKRACKLQERLIELEECMPNPGGSANREPEVSPLKKKKRQLSKAMLRSKLIALVNRTFKCPQRREKAFQIVKNLDEWTDKVDKKIIRLIA